jgi:site-specific recombinase XerD
MRLDNAHESWNIDLRSRNISARTRETYGLAVAQLIDWLKQRGHSLDVADITSNDIRLFIGHM